MTLIISNVTTEDGGTYTCVAKNDFGRAKANLKLDLSQGWIQLMVSVNRGQSGRMGRIGRNGVNREQQCESGQMG